MTHSASDGNFGEDHAMDRALAISGSLSVRSNGPCGSDVIPEDVVLLSDSSGEFAGLDNERLIFNRRLQRRSNSFQMRGKVKRKNSGMIGPLAVCFITYFNVCGGPWGSEEIVSTVGPLFGFIGMIALVMFWAFPMVLITSEMSSMFPDDGGYSIWVAEAFGPFWGFQEAFWSWSSGVVDAASYPVLAIDSLRRLLGSNSDLQLWENNVWVFYCLKVFLAVLFTLPNLFTANAFGKWMTFLTAFVFLPFFVQIIYVLVYRFDDLQWSNLLEVKSDSTISDWMKFISVLYWNFSGFDSASTCAGEVHRPERSYPVGLFSAAALILMTYMVPLGLFVAVGTPAWNTWMEGDLSRIALEQVGKWLASWIVVSSFAANIGMYTAEIFEDSCNLAGMANIGLVPKIFGKRISDTGAPYIAIGYSLLIVTILLGFNFDELVSITNVFSCLSALFEILSFCKLRLAKPEMYRPFKVPVSSPVALAFFVSMPCLLGIFICVSSLASSWSSVIVNSILLVSGGVIYHFSKLSAFH